MTARKGLLLLAHTIDQRLAANYESYLDDCERDRNRKHTPHYCEHGTDQWVAYDNICGGCEDGITNGDPLQRRRLALYLAHQRFDQVNEVTSALVALCRAGLGHAVDSRAIATHISDLLVA